MLYLFRTLLYELPSGIYEKKYDNNNNHDNIILKRILVIYSDHMASKTGE